MFICLSVCLFPSSWLVGELCKVFAKTVKFPRKYSLLFLYIHLLNIYKDLNMKGVRKRLLQDEVYQQPLRQDTCGFCLFR